LYNTGRVVELQSMLHQPEEMKTEEQQQMEIF
jgi:hypothetical protein